MKNIRDVRVGRKDLHALPPALLTIREGYNVRFIDNNSPDFVELKESIRKHGVRTPLTVQTEKKGDENVFYIVAGHRRHAAVQELIEEGVEIVSVPCISVKMGEEELALDLITSNDGKPLNQLEQGAVFKRLEGYGWSVDKMVSETGKSPTHIYNCLQLQVLPASVKSKVNKGTLSSSLALELLKEHGQDSVASAVKDAQKNASSSGKEKITRKNTGKTRKSSKKEISQAEFDRTDKFIDKLPESVQTEFKDFLSKKFVVSVID